MKLENVRTLPATVTPSPAGQVELPVARPTPETITDCWNPTRPLPGNEGKLDDFFYKRGLDNKGSEDLDAERTKQEERAAAALKQFPPDFAAYKDANSKIEAIDAEKSERAMEQRGFEVGLRFQDDKGVEKALDAAQAELDQVMADPKASEADRERARARLSAVLAELDRRD